ncbi:MAG: GlsB/YeaQ/YmgE family stress response membrane protein [Chloroflexota bacterium]|nr:GlsB/YeaQ/YmgE family stress response membrane protein [Chloroflexota bacterium]
MPELGVIGWIVVGFFAGALSGVVVGDRTPGGCLANILIGVLGGIVGGFLARELFGREQTVGWIGSFVVAFIGAVIIRYLLSVARR